MCEIYILAALGTTAIVSHDELSRGLWKIFQIISPKVGVALERLINVACMYIYVIYAYICTISRKQLS